MRTRISKGQTYISTLRGVNIIDYVSLLNKPNLLVENIDLKTQKLEFHQVRMYVV